MTKRVRKRILQWGILLLLLAGLAALLAIMAVCEDSNVIHRAGYGYWRDVYPRLVADTAVKFDPRHPDYRPLYALEAAFLPLRVSPGGAADLLSCTYFLNFLQKDIIY